MVGSVGMAAAYGGYQQARKADNEIAAGDIGLENAKLDQEAVKALGNAIPILQQMMMPGAQAMPQGGGVPPPQQMARAPQVAPQPPAPGQPSQPMTQGPAPQMLGGPAPPSDPTMQVRPDVPPGSVGDRFGGLPGGGAPPAPPMPQQPQMPPQGAQPPQGVPQRGAVPQQPQGTMNLHTVMGAVVKANPGASPQVIAMALAKALPLMTAQSQMDYKQLMTQLAGGKLQEAATHNAATETNTANRIQSVADTAADREGGRNQRFETGEAGKNTRAQLSNETRLAVSTLSAETRREIAEMQDAGRTGRTQLSVDARREIAKLNSNTRMEILGIVEEGKDKRFAAGEEGKTNRQQFGEANKNARQLETQSQQWDRQERSLQSREGIAGQNETGRQERFQQGQQGQNTRQERAIGSREGIVATTEQGRNDRFGQGQDRQDIRQQNSIGSREGIAERREGGINDRFGKRQEFLSRRIELQSKALDRAVARDKTLADNAENRKTLRLLEDENNAEYKRTQQKIQAQSGMATPKAKAQLMQDAEETYNKTKMRIEGYKRQMDGGGMMPEGSDTPPVETLKEGHVTNFTNGQKWTLQGGKPVKVP